MDKQARIRRGRQARIILADPVFLEAFNEAKGQVFADFANSHPTERDLQGNLHGQIGGIAHVLDVFAKYVQDGSNLEKPISPEGK